MLAQTLKLCEVDFGEFDDPDYPTIIQHSATQVNHLSALGFGQYCGSVTFWYGSESADPQASNLWIRILLFSSLTFKMPTKK
jgi:hypothetical protein